MKKSFIFILIIIIFIIITIFINKCSKYESLDYSKKPILDYSKKPILVNTQKQILDIKPMDNKINTFNKHIVAHELNDILQYEQNYMNDQYWIHQENLEIEHLKNKIITEQNKLLNNQLIAECAQCAKTSVPIFIEKMIEIEKYRWKKNEINRIEMFLPWNEEYLNYLQNQLQYMQQNYNTFDNNFSSYIIQHTRWLDKLKQIPNYLNQDKLIDVGTYVNNLQNFKEMLKNRLQWQQQLINMMTDSISRENNELIKLKNEVKSLSTLLEKYIICTNKYNICSIFNEISNLIHQIEYMHSLSYSTTYLKMQMHKLTKYIHNVENKLSPELNAYINCMKDNKLNIGDIDTHNCIKNITKPLLQKLINCTSQPCDLNNKVLCYEQCVDNTLKENIFFPWWDYFFGDSGFY